MIRRVIPFLVRLTKKLANIERSSPYYKDSARARSLYESEHDTLWLLALFGRLSGAYWIEPKATQL
ncbi:hypothetical protein VCR12J2_620525 [Vibrio coralliirubri]|nr:hypothetical protein VCR12J2_620525 [Vibrio coralliirubri]